MKNPTERRRYERYEIKLPATIEVAGSRRVQCLVRDYCSGGMLLSLKAGQDSEKLFSVGQRAGLKTHLLTHAGRRPITIKSTVAWLNGNYLGIEFAKPSDLIVEVLVRHDRYAREEAKPAVGESRPVKGDCINRIAEAAKGLLPGMLRAVVNQTLDVLMETVDRVSSDVERQQVYGDMNALERLRQQDTLVRAVIESAIAPADPDQLSSTPGELKLVDTVEFERWLEASRTATLLERKFRPRLATIGARIVALRDDDAAVSLVVPFEPKNFTDGLSRVARDIELGALTRSVMFESCADLLSESLDVLYDEIDATLDAVGAPVQDVANAMRVMHGVGGTKDAVSDVDDSVSVDANPASESNIEPATVPAPVTIDSQRLQTLLAQERALRERQAVELVGGLSAEIADDSEFSAWVDLIGQPLIHEAASDPKFFHNNDHPLRTIIDQLGHLQQFFTRPADELTEQLQHQVDELLDPLSRGEPDDATIDTVAAGIGALTRSQSEEYRRNVERVVESSEGRDRVRRARLIVASEIDRRYAGRRVPALLPELLDVGWRSVLELAWLNAETGRGEYQRHLVLLDSLVALLGGTAFAPRKGELDRTRLVRRITEQLETTAVDPFRRDAVETRLRTELNGTVDKVAMLQMPTQQQTERTALDERPEDIGERAWRDAVDRCRGLRLGDRVTLEQVSNKVTRVAWMRANRESFTLVDHRGVRVQDITLRELALALNKGRAALETVDGSPLSERAMRRMLDEMEHRLSQHTGQDSLTGLMNRAQFQAELEKAVAAAGGGALLWIDVDQFKVINELHDYATGDRLLVALTDLIQRCEASKTIGHLGADRFAVLLPGLAVEQAQDWAGRLLDLVHAMQFDWQGRNTTLQLSIGLAGLEAAHETVADLTRAVENALAAAKRAGGDQVYVYRDDDPDMARQRDSVEWLARVDEALVDGHLRLRCQPIVPVRPDAGLAPHLEVLLGVASSSNESLSIAEFIDAAERYKRMRAVDRWVARTVFDWIAGHRELMPMIHGLAVNLSGQTASDPSFVEFVRQQFQRTGIDPEWISFEVTETAAVASLSSAAGIIHGLKNLGCRIALDDFGSGQASYSYLKELPVDWLKIDGVFVRNIANDREDFAVVKSINEIGHFLGKKTIAEYVTDARTLELVREIGVDYAQGYGIAPPTLLDDYAALIEEQMAPKRAAQLRD